MKKRIIISIIILLVGSTLFIIDNKKINQEITIENLENNKSIAIYIKDDNGNYNKTSNIPASGYTLNTTKSVCTNNAKPSWNIKTNSLKISNLTSNNTGCYLYFDKLEGLALEMANAKPSLDGFTGIADTDEGMFYAEDDWGTTYYYRGAVTDNWFKFANLYWRIIRVNGDGSIRIIYNGTTTDQTGETTGIGTSKYSHKDAYYKSTTDNAYVSDNAYVGYMYGTAGSSTYAETHDNINDSEIKNAVEAWYKSSIIDKGYGAMVSTEAGFCNDRKIDKTVYSSYQGDGYGTSNTTYSPWGRLYQNGEWKAIQKPTLKCNQAINDLFTTSNSTKGNKKLTYPVGLITSDEVIYAGGFGGAANTNFYLYNNQTYWTMSPSFGSSTANVLIVDLNCMLTSSFNTVSNASEVRPVINLSSDVKLIGDGTSSNPYQIEGVE